MSDRQIILIEEFESIKAMLLIAIVLIIIILFIKHLGNMVMKIFL